MDKKVFLSNSGQEFVILKEFKVNGKQKLIVQFIETGSTREVFKENAMAGKLKDLYAKTVYGVGCLGEYKHIPYWKKASQLWHNVMKRCYSDNDPKGYKHKRGTTVEARWHCFANFLEDLPKLKNFDKWMQGGDCTHTRYTLDKDAIDYDANIYSRYTCSFETEHSNKSAGAINARATDPRYI